MGKELETLKERRDSALALEIPDSELARYQKRNCILLIEAKMAEIIHIMGKQGS